jgi:flagellar motor switch protein FliN
VVIIAGANAKSLSGVLGPQSLVAAVQTVPTLDKVTVDLMVVLGTTTMPIHQVLRLSRGAIIELDATEADEVKVLANNLPVASGVVLVDRNRIAVEVKQMLPRTPGTR